MYRGKNNLARSTSRSTEVSAAYIKQSKSIIDCYMLFIEENLKVDKNGLILYSELEKRFNQWIEERGIFFEERKYNYFFRQLVPIICSVFKNNVQNIIKMLGYQKKRLQVNLKQNTPCPRRLKFCLKGVSFNT